MDASQGIEQIEQTGRGLREFDKSFNFKYLTPLAHIILGSSIPGKEPNQPLQGVGILKQGPDYYLRPLGLMREFGPDDIAKVNSGRVGTYIDCLPLIFDAKSIQELYTNDYLARFILPRVGPDGKTPPAFSFQLIHEADGKRNPVAHGASDVVSKLTIRDELKPFIRIEKSPKQDTFMMTVSSNQKHSL